LSEFIPNSFQVPNLMVDEIAGQISPKAFACLIFIVRKTRGWNKSSDLISVGQFKRFLQTKDDRTVQRIIDELEQFNLITVFRSLGQINEFSLGDLFKPPAKNEGTLNEGTHKKCNEVPAKNVGTLNEGTHKKCNEVPTKNGGGGTHKKWGSTKDNIKTNTNIKEKIHKKEKTASEPVTGNRTVVDPEFKPTDQDISILTLKGISIDFIKSQIPEFVLYWQEVGIEARDWRAKFRNRVTDLHMRGFNQKSSSIVKPSFDFSGVETSGGALDDIE
jgi:hypothetical protein